MENPPLKTFICYAHEDHEVVSALRKHLAVFEKRGLLEIWFDGKILAGENWDKSIKTKLEHAELVLMFISVDFINSDYIEKTELQAALQRHRDGQATLIPIIVRSCHWSDYFEMGKFQALPKNARPILSQHFPFRDDAFHEVAEGVRLTAQDWLEKRATQLRAEAEAAEQSSREEAARRSEQTRAHQQQQRDEAAWKTTQAEAERADNEPDKIAAYDGYLDEAAHTLHREEAENHISELRAVLETRRRIEEKKRQEAERQAEEARRKTEEEKKRKEAERLAAETRRKAEEEQKRKAVERQAAEEKTRSETAERQKREAEARAKNLPEMIFVKGGTFQMGEKGVAEPVHAVTVGDFYLGKYAVTFEEYDRFCDETKREKPKDQGWGRGNRPVTNVSWGDSQAYCAWLSKTSGEKFRLPTEAEWEYAAREGGKNIRFGNGKNIADPVEINFDGGKKYKQDYSVAGEVRGKTVPVGSLNCPNALGLHDMSGNVWEWCEDWYGDYNSTAQTNPKGPASGSLRVLRGGSWSYNPQYCRTAHRSNVSPGVRIYHVGFRLARAVSL